MQLDETLRTNEAGVNRQGTTDQFLTFTVNEAEYGVDILRVQEIRGWSQPMQIPHAPSFIKGVINIRGEVVPIADLRERLGLGAIEPGGTTAIVVLRISEGERDRVIGIVVDAMSEVTTIPRAAIKRPPDLDASESGTVVTGIATHTDKMVTILDVKGLFGVQSGAI